MRVIKKVHVVTWAVPYETVRSLLEDLRHIPEDSKITEVDEDGDDLKICFLEETEEAKDEG